MYCEHCFMIIQKPSMVGYSGSRGLFLHLIRSIAHMDSLSVTSGLIRSILSLNTPLGPARTCPHKAHESSKDGNMATIVTPEQAGTCMQRKNHCPNHNIHDPNRQFCTIKL